MEKVTRLVRNFYAFGAGCSMALVFGVIFVNAVRRYTIGKSIAWGEELPIYLAIYGVMFGISYAYMQDGHIRFTILIDTIAEKSKAWLFAFCDVLTCASGVALVFAGHAFAMRRGHVDSSGLKAVSKWIAESTGIDALVWIGKVGTWQYAMAIGGGMIAVAALLRLIERIREIQASKADPKSEEEVAA
ncbi:TRAP transporter small permease subunit [uncultured Cohaesibacter sp.]|uniref:TRAP transporter small permease n=1 Tax=uncultured Cohaesibacter sp. TaxID=1002546 RepID=UPI0029C9472B|nr:TRAP transporter small permease subunit [uncultured Cohaesibacter sp.]